MTHITKITKTFVEIAKKLDPEEIQILNEVYMRMEISETDLGLIKMNVSKQQFSKLLMLTPENRPLFVQVDDMVYNNPNED